MLWSNGLHKTSSVMYHRNAKHETDKHNRYLNIAERSNIDVSPVRNTLRLIVVIQPGVHNMPIIICACRVSVEWYSP